MTQRHAELWVEGAPSPTAIIPLGATSTSITIHARDEATLRALMAGEARDLGAVASQVTVDDGTVVLRGIPPLGTIPIGLGQGGSGIPGADADIVGGPDGSPAWVLHIRNGRFTDTGGGRAPQVVMTSSWPQWIRLLRNGCRVRDLVRAGTLHGGFAGLSVLSTALIDPPYTDEVAPYSEVLAALEATLSRCGADRSRSDLA